MSWIDVLLATSACALAGAAGIWTHRRTDGSPRFRLLVAATAAGALATTLAAAAALWLAQPADPWNAARLAPALGLHHGFRLHYPLDAGPVLSTVVGPTAFLAYWPVGFVPGSPTTLILLASAANLLAFAILGAWCCRRVAGPGPAALFSWLIGAHLVLLYPALRYSLFCIHADAPALLLGGTGVALLIFAPPTLSWRRGAGAALCLTLAVWAKQSLAPIIFAAALLAFLHDGRRGGSRLVAAFAVVALAVSLGFIAWCGLAELRDNMLVVPARHPWQQMDLATGEIFPGIAAVGATARLKVLVAAALHLVRSNWPFFALLGGALLVHQVRRAPDAPRWPRTSWAGFFLVAVILFPTAVVGRTKLGGEVNHESFVVFFLIAAVIAWLATSSSREPRTRLAVLTAALAVLVLVTGPRALEYHGWAAAWKNQNETAWQYERAHPRAVYFPWNPLTPLLTRGALEHFDYGVFDRALGGAAPTPAHLTRHLPAARPVIASFIAHHDHILHTYFPDYVARPPDPELPGWRLYGPP